MLRHKIAQHEPLRAGAPTAGSEGHDIVLRPIVPSGLQEIHIDDTLFAVGRAEEPFASYAPEIVTDLSRRHARIFSEAGAAYIADLNSKNGTTVNGVDIRQKTSRLRDGDEVCFGRTLCYRVQLSPRLQTHGRPTKLASLTLTPEAGNLGLQPIIVTQFPFLVSKADTTFSRYKDQYPHQVNYLSRRHAHIFLKGDTPFVEDLGSTNGTFIGGKRLDEHAVALQDGDVLALGGHHFVYKASLQRQQAEPEPTLTMLSPLKRSIAENSGDADKTTFVAAPGSFLDIFCIDQAAQQDDEINNEEAKQSGDDAAKSSEKRRARGRLAIMLSELLAAFASDGERKGRGRWWAAGAAVVLALAGVVLYLGQGPERELKDILARGKYGEAAALAGRYAQRYPDNVEIRSLGTEAVLKANVPKWLAQLKARQFDQATAVISHMERAGAGNADLQSLTGELKWMTSLEQLVAGRGGVDAPIRIYRDEDNIKALLQRWDDDAKGHQRALARIASYVPEFKDPYTVALSHLRKLQSDDSVYLSAIDRLKSAINTELNQDRPQALEPLLKEYADKYPRIGGLDSVRRDLRQYMALDQEAGARNLGPLVMLLTKARFETPPFQEKFRALAKSDRLPPPEMVQQYQVVSAAWQKGNTRDAFDGLQKMSAGPWADAAARELAHKKRLADQFAELQKTRTAAGYDQRLIAFYGALRADEDVFFIRAIEADINLYKGKAFARAQELMKRAEEQWRQYRENGPIGGKQRLESPISEQFRLQARLLSQADQSTQQGMRIVTQLKADFPAQWSKLRDEVDSEAQAQRKSLLELRTVLEPGVYKAKLALLDSRSEDERQSSKTAD